MGESIIMTAPVRDGAGAVGEQTMQGLIRTDRHADATLSGRAARAAARVRAGQRSRYLTAGLTRKLMAVTVIVPTLASSWTGDVKAQAGKTPPAAPAPAEENAELVKSTAATIKNMGLSISDVGTSHIRFKDRNVDYDLDFSHDGTKMYLSTWWNVPKDKTPKMPVDELLKWNVDHSTYFAIKRFDSGNAEVSLIDKFESKVADPPFLRQSIDALSEDATRNDPLLDSSKWK